MPITCSKTDHDALDLWTATRGLKESRGRLGWEAVTSKRPAILREGTHWEDHCDLWTRNRKPVCFTSQPYDFDETPAGRERLAEIAVKHGLYIEIGEHTSWYYPGLTILIAIWPSKAEADFRLPTHAGPG